MFLVFPDLKPPGWKRNALPCRLRYENDEPNTRFTEAQLAEIRKATLSKVLCANLDADGDMQRSALDQPSNFL